MKEYESDSIASDSADEKKIRAAERRAVSSKKRRTSSETTTKPPNTSISGRLDYKGESSTRKPKPSDICLHCGERGHWKRPYLDQGSITEGYGHLESIRFNAKRGVL